MKIKWFLVLTEKVLYNYIIRYCNPTADEVKKYRDKHGVGLAEAKRAVTKINMKQFLLIGKEGMCDDATASRMILMYMFEYDII